MSYANGTTFYNLPQTVGTDKRDWFDTNQAFANVDAALHTAVTGQAADAEAIATLQTGLASANEDIASLQSTTSTHTSQIATLSNATSQNTSDIAAVRNDAEDMVTAYNEASATSTHAYSIGDYFIYNDVLYKATAAIAIGDTIVPDTNCETTNITTEISEVKSDLASKVSTSDVVISDGVVFNAYKRTITGPININGTDIGDDSSVTEMICMRINDGTYAALIVGMITGSNNGALYNYSGKPLSSGMHHSGNWGPWYDLTN